MRLFAFPHAGGCAHGFRSWPQELQGSVEVCAAEYPGRWCAPSSEAAASMEELLALLLPHMDLRARLPFVLFGHSLGARLAFETARLLRKRGWAEPEGLIVSGCRAPHLERVLRTTHLLPDRDFLNYLARLDGMPPEILTQPELVEIVLPVLRADVRILEQYQYHHEPPLTCPIVAMGGEDDPDLSISELAAWWRHTASAFRMHVLPGGHFYLDRESRRTVPELISTAIASLGEKSRVEGQGRFV